jgi:hypothetical protein
MSNVPLPEPHHQSAANFNAPDEPFYTADQMHAHAAAVSAAKDAEISGLQNFKTMHLEMVAKWAGDIGEALGEPSEDFKPDDLIALAGKVKIQRDALRADNIRLQNEVVMPLRERVRELTTQAMFNASTIERLRAEAAGLREDAERLEFIQNEYLHIIPFAMPTGADDSEVGWQVHIEAMNPADGFRHTEYRDNLRAAIDAARKGEA